ncbi:MAG: hypothetical protein ACR2P4_10785 [Gammaproteobacteria bacterium]
MPPFSSLPPFRHYRKSGNLTGHFRHSRVGGNLQTTAISIPA